MTAATTLPARFPVLGATGWGLDIMVPMAIASFAGMRLVFVRVLTVPVLYSCMKEHRVSAVE
jgi:multidrug efflux pump subunit AcrB